MMLLATLQATIAASALASNLWLHVRVERADDPKRVTVNLPLSALERAAPLFPKGALGQSRIELEGTTLRFRDFSAIVRSLEKHPMAWVRIDRGDGPVLFSRRGDQIHLSIEREENWAASRGEMRMPLAIAQALVSGNRGEFNIPAAIEYLAANGGEILLVDRDDARVRFWVDAIAPVRTPVVATIVQGR